MIDLTVKPLQGGERRADIEREIHQQVQAQLAEQLADVLEAIS